MAPPFTHPLPSRPTTGLPPRIPHQQQQAPPPPLAAQRAFFSAPQPASPRPPGSPFGNASSPKIAVGIGGGGGARADREGGPLVVEDPVAWAKKALSKEELTTNSELLELGEEWEVHWRTWQGPALVSSPCRAATQASAPQRTPSGRPTDGRPLKRPKMSAFDELLADELSASTASSASASPTASTSAALSSAPLLIDKLQELHTHSPAEDPVEKARLYVLDRARTVNPTKRLFALFPYVKIVSNGIDDLKGKGKAKEESPEDSSRVLWVFSVVKGPNPSHSGTDGEDSESRAALSALNELELDGLLAVDTGRFAHRDLFPNLYPSTPASPSDSTIRSPSPPFVNPSSLSAKQFPSAIAISQELHADLSQSPVHPSRTRSPYEAFLHAATDSIVTSLLTDSPSTSNSCSQPITSRLGDTVVFLPGASEPFGTAGRRIVARAVQTSFLLSLQRHGIFILSAVTDIALRPYPLLVPPLANSPVLLAPFGTPARFIEAHARKLGSPQESSLYKSWKGVVDGTGLALADEETWLLCRIDLPPTSPAEASTESIEVVWPASLCLLDGTRIQPHMSPQATPPRPKSHDLVTAPEDIGRAKPATRSHLLAPFDVVTRRRLASVLRRRTSSSATYVAYRDPIASRAEKVGVMLEEMAVQQEKHEREREEKDDMSVDASSLLPSTGPAAMNLDTKSGGMAPGNVLAGAPINMRTPISLGGSSTEAPSPADGFQPAERYLGGLLSQLPVDNLARNLEADQLYPSPPEANLRVTSQALPLPSVTDTIFAPIESSFGEFDWGDDFGSGRMPSNLQQDFDDGMGMMMGITDDDFSFFDDPTPVATISTNFGGITSPNFTGLQSSGPSPKFVDHFSHLNGGTPFASANSPISPFTQSYPHLNHSPGVSGYQYDPQTPHMTGNALGIGMGTPGGSALVEGSPFKTPRTPYSPFLELTEDPVSFHSGVSVAGTPAVGLSSSQRPSRASPFDPIQFGASHSISDDKYDARKGKFGLPSPDYDPAVKTTDLPVFVVEGKVVRWYGTICDPRVTASVELKRHRTPSLHKIKPKLNSSKGDFSGVARSRTWIRSDVDSDYCGEEESDDEEMDVDYDSDPSSTEDVLLSNLGKQERGALQLNNLLGPALVLLRDHLAFLLDAIPRLPLTVVPPSKATAASESALDGVGSIITEQVVYNPDFRAQATDALLLRPSVIASSKLVSSYAINLVRDRLSGFATRNRIASSLAGESDDPQLTEQVAPAILLRAQQSVMQMCTSAMRFWRPMGFEPLTGPKNVAAFAVYEEGGEDLNVAVKAWLHRVSEAYRASRLGEHAPISIGTVQGGLAVLPSGSLSRPGARDEVRPLCNTIAEAVRSGQHVVVYLLTPAGALPTSPSSPVATTIQLINKLRSNTLLPPLVYPMPLSAIADSRTMFLGDSTSARLERLAFAVYDQLLIPVARLKFPMPETFPSAPFAHTNTPAVRPFQFPAITLSPFRKPKIQFELNWPASSLEVMHRHRILHVGYTVTPVEGATNLEWIVATCIDEKGELWKTVSKLLRRPANVSTETARVTIVYGFAKSMADFADVEWRIVITRLGLLSKEEMKAWHVLLKEKLASTNRPLHVTIACSDLQPPLSVVQLPSMTSRSPASPPHDAEEGEVTRLGPTGSTISLKPPHIEAQSSLFAFTPSDLVAIGPQSDLIVPASTYLIHVPRIASLAHTLDLDPLLIPSASSPSISILGLHLVTAFASPSSSLSITLSEHLADIRQSFAEVSAIGQTRWGTSGRIPWHLEAIATVGVLLSSVK
ncbi:hypothetical protein P7C70_g3492, partial [Phenoliferia sp. Uapishka_3]